MTQGMQMTPPKHSGEGRRSFQSNRRQIEPSNKASFPWINGQIIAAAEKGSLNQLVVTIDAYLTQMNLVNLATALHRLAKMTAGDSNAQNILRQMLMPKLLTVLKNALKRATTAGSPPKPQVISNVTWALATMQLPDDHLVEMLATLATRKMVDFKHFELSTLLWAFAKLGALEPSVSKCSQPVFLAAAEYSATCLDQFTFRGLVMLVWAFATARLHDAMLFHAIGEKLLPQVHIANTQELANTVWSFSTAGVYKEKLFRRVAEEAIPRLREFKPQELSSIIWSFAAIGANHEAFYETAANVVVDVGLQGQQLANILWALTRVRAQHPSTKKTVLALLPRCTRLITTFKPQELSSVALAAAKSFGCQRDDQDDKISSIPCDTLPTAVTTFFAAALPLIAFDLRKFSGQSLANIASSFLAVQIGLDSELFPAVGCEAMIRAKHLDNSALLLLLKTLPNAPTSTPVQGAISMLFVEVATRINSFHARELQVLTRICTSLSSTHDAAARMHRDQLRECCLALAKCHSSTSQSSPIEQIKQSVNICPDEATKDEDASAAGSSDMEMTKDEDASAAGSSDMEFWNAHMTVEVATTGRPPSAWDAKATQDLRESLESATFLRDETVESASPNARGQVTHFVFSVKNTFLDVAERGESENCSEEDESPPLPPLPPALSFIPTSVSPERLAAYRADYARFRIGYTSGAKGELCTTIVM